MEDLPKCSANYMPLSPLSFLERAALVYAKRFSIIYGDVRFTWAETRERCARVASFLVNSQALNVSRGDVVSVLAPNVPALYEMHFAVPMAGSVLNTINTRLDVRNVATILSHSQAKVLFVDYQLLPLAKEALTLTVTKPRLILIHDDPCHMDSELMNYEDLVRGGDPRFDSTRARDEWESIAVNYTSGTTSAPKGVVYSHRGAYLSSLAVLLMWNMPIEPVYLWTLPMFHCNGWTFTWAVAARGGTNVCIRNTTAKEIFSAIGRHGVTHLCCAPIVFNILLNAKPQERQPLPPGRVKVLTGGAPPPPPVLSKMEEMGFQVTHAYGLTEATGPALVCEWKNEWDVLSPSERAAMKGRQGVSVLSLDSVDVKDPLTLSSVARDGESIGEIMLKGSGLMKGYLHDPNSTAQAFAGGWFRTGDVGVVHPDGYVEIKDRSKDVIISGGENISSVEVESLLYTHPLVTEAAVVAMPHPHWGETPCAFINTKQKVKEEDILSFCRDRLPHYMAPKAVVFMELPKTSTGKIQKFLLRDIAKNLSRTSARSDPPPSIASTKTLKEKKAVTKERHQSLTGGNDYIIVRSRL
uniref:AMP-dependent synthetase/ligase domain-containing protein n=1 Tax=Araucaria cunninghamii TaxID=56994 RepID=A0A0D6QRI9_ARACU